MNMNMKMSCTTSLLPLACLFLTATSQEANTAVEQLSSAEIATKLLQHGAPRALIDHVLDAALDGTQVCIYCCSCRSCCFWRRCVIRVLVATFSPDATLASRLMPFPSRVPRGSCLDFRCYSRSSRTCKRTGCFLPRCRLRRGITWKRSGDKRYRVAKLIRLKTQLRLHCIRKCAKYTNGGELKTCT